MLGLHTDNHRDPERVALAYTPESEWRNRAEFLRGREAITEVCNTMQQPCANGKAAAEVVAAAPAALDVLAVQRCMPC